MAQNTPWSIKGVDPEAREAAKIAARRAGLTIGQWISQTVLATAAAQLTGTARPTNGAATGRTAPPDPAPAVPPQGSAPPPAPTIQALFENIQKLTNRIEQAEVRAAASVGPLAERIDELSQQIENSRSEASVSTAPVERALTRLSERIDRMEEGESPPRRRPGRWRLFGD